MGVVLAGVWPLSLQLLTRIIPLIPFLDLCVGSECQRETVHVLESSLEIRVWLSVRATLPHGMVQAG